MGYLLKANHNLILPDGETEIKVGETFEWDGEIDIFGKCVDVVGELENKNPEALKPMNITQIRARAKELSITNYKTKDVEVLKVEIAKSEKTLSNAQASNGGNDNPEGGNNVG